MAIASLEISLCSPDFREEALALVLVEIAPSQRREIAGALVDGADAGVAAAESLYVAMRGGRLCGAAWAQRQPGNTAVFWPPRLTRGEHSHTAHLLAEAVIRHLDCNAIGMSQTLLPVDNTDLVPVLTAVGYSHLADLLYLTCEAERFPSGPTLTPELQFVVWDPVERGRLLKLIERTYDGTLDCPALNGGRRIEEVVDGYQATGMFRSENWLIVQRGGQDVGVLLLADHPAAEHWELMYMGLVPEARGHGWGQEIARHAQWMAKNAGIERVVLAVDVLNRPALAMYERVGFLAWDRRRVFVRILR